MEKANNLGNSAMVNISREDVLKIARMSNIQIREDEIDQIARNLASVINYAARVQEIAVDVEIPSVRNVNVFREDVPSESIGERVLSRAPESEAQYFVVPAIIEK
jgi:aspartyl-tRNA(Asn)/glutamyl-tRNA(Gln) amidotransferase subunit C